MVFTLAATGKLSTGPVIFKTRIAKFQPQPQENA